MRPAQSARRDAFLQKIGGRPVIMGILNVTPDSFSDGGAFTNADLAVARAKQMVADGCDIVDLGGESTRPGATPLGAADELARVEPILTMLDGDLDAPVSIDTYKASVAARAIEHGAIVVNDVWGLQKDPAMAEVVAAAEAAVVIMHNRAEKDPSLDILADIRRFFDRSLTLADNAGIHRERIILDPGIGFAKTSHQNRDVVARLGELRNYALPILVGASRKTFLGGLSDGSEGSLFGTIAVNLAAAANGASIFRVHDVAPNRAALGVFYSVRADTTRVPRAP
jgi:dihydropteroate synthase